MNDCHRVRGLILGVGTAGADKALSPTLQPLAPQPWPTLASPAELQAWICEPCPSLGTDTISPAVAPGSALARSHANTYKRVLSTDRRAVSPLYPGTSGH